MQKVKIYDLSIFSQIKITSLFVLIFLLSSCRIQSQVPSYPIKTINGVEYIIYKVQPGEGFYRVGKNLNTTEAEIRKHNLHAADGLKAGMEIYIPVSQETKPSKEGISTSTTSNNDKNYIEHLVEKKQTIFSIRRMYDITEEELLDANPHLKNKILQTGEILRIPIKGKKEDKEEVLELPEPKKDQEEDKELPTKPEKDQEEDKKLPAGLERDQERDKQSDNDVKEEELSTYDDSLGWIDDIFGKAENDKIDIEKDDKTADTQWLDKKSKDAYSIAFLLPFMLDQRLEASDKRFIEFYAGSLIAIKHLKERGVNFNVYAFDVAKTENKLRQLIESGDLDSMDLVVGPAYSSQIPLICEFARMQKIKTLVPFSARIYNLDSNEYIYQFNPGQELEIVKLESILKHEELDSNVIFADLANINPSDDAYIRSISLKHFMDDNHYPYKELTLHPDSMHLISRSLNPMTDNIVFFNTSRINHVSLYLRELKRLSSHVNLKFYEPYSWKSSEIEKPRSCYISAFKDEYSTKEYESYVREFKMLFNWEASTELPRYDLLGYDLVQYFVRYILAEKDDKPFNYPYYKGLQSDITFEKVSLFGGYINTDLKHFE